MMCEYCKTNISFQDKECEMCGAPNEPKPIVYMELASKLKALSISNHVGRIIEYTGTQRPVMITPSGVEYL